VSALRERLFAVSCGGMFVFGMILGLPGTVLGLPETVQQFGLTLADRGLLIATLFAGLLLGSLLSGPLVDALGQRAALLVSSALVALCLPLFALATSFLVASSALIALGLASASINTASNALSSELFPGERGRRMNMIAVMVGLGGLTMPTATVLASASVSWRAVVIGGGVLSGVVALLIATVPSVSSPNVRRDGPIAALRHFSTQPGFAACVLVIMLGGGNEAAMAGWTSSFVEASGMSPSAATWILSSHWLGLILSRVFFSSRIDSVKELAVEHSAMLSALVLFVLVVVATPSLVMVGPFMVGFCMALVMPTSLALAGERIQGNPGALFGGLLTVAQVGGMLIPASIGLVAEQTNVRTGLAVLIASYGAIAVIVRSVLPHPYQHSSKDG
jgi:DHA1 family bicyclomycin/chloramphenicol resistance-like MFS transporter